MTDETETRKTQFVVLDKHGMPWGPFDDATEAAQWAKRKWPDQEQDERRMGDGWDIAVLHSPDE